MTVEEITVSTSDLVVTIDENPTNGQLLGTVEGITNTGSVAFSITDESPNGAFSINETSGELTVRDSDLFDFEVNPQLLATIRVQNGEASKNSQVTINLNDLEEVTVSTTDFTVTIDENPINGQVLGMVEGSTNEGSVTFTITDESIAGTFSINETNGELAVKNREYFDFEVNPKLLATVEVRNGTVSKNSNVTVNLNDVDESISFTKIEVTGTHFVGTSNHQAVAFDNKIWVIGGQGNAGVWQSSDGVTWNEMANPFGRPFGHQSIVFNGKLWVIDREGTTNRIWSTVDGTTWTRETISGNIFNYRGDFQIVEFNQKLWVIAGSGSGLYNDIWSSTDGINWTQETIVGDHFLPRSRFQAVVFNDKIWVIGGAGQGSQCYSDVWSSPDGTTWTQEEVIGEYFSTRRYFQLVVHDDKLWLIAGHNCSNLTNEIWTSTDGINWIKEEITGTVFSARNGHQALVFDNTIWVIGGTDGTRHNDIWRLNK